MLLTCPLYSFITFTHHTLSFDTPVLLICRTLQRSDGILDVLQPYRVCVATQRVVSHPVEVRLARKLQDRLELQRSVACRIVRPPPKHFVTSWSNASSLNEPGMADRSARKYFFAFPHTYSIPCPANSGWHFGDISTDTPIPFMMKTICDSSSMKSAHFSRSCLKQKGSSSSSAPFGLL